tara:strand:+ start:1498 stop:2034 length:537 start_codon:yes stop_codon:yes gene_type:complete
MTADEEQGEPEGAAEAESRPRAPLGPVDLERLLTAPEGDDGPGRSVSEMLAEVGSLMPDIRFVPPWIADSAAIDRLRRAGSVPIDIAPLTETAASRAADAAERTADHAERTADYTAGLLRAMHRSVELNEETRAQNEASRAENARARRWTTRMSVVSLAVAVASWITAFGALLVTLMR